MLILCRIDDILEIHTVVACEEGERKEDHSDDGEDHDCFILRVGDEGQFILLDGAQLEKLNDDQYPV